MIHVTAALLLTTMTAAVAQGETAPLRLPSGSEVWLQEVLTDRMQGTGLVQRYRFVMPALEEMVPPLPEEDPYYDIPPELFDEPQGGFAPLSPEDQAMLDEGLGELVIEALPSEDLPTGSPDPGLDGGYGGTDLNGGYGGDALAGPDGGAALEGDSDVVDAPLPSELLPPDEALAPGAEPDAEAAGDLAAGGGMALPAAPDVLMQDPMHKDIAWLCENFVLPRARASDPPATQVVISLASAPSEFGTFDPNVVQLFEGFSLPPGEDRCVWEPL